MTGAQRIGQVIDGALAVIFPGWAAKRMGARAQLHVLRQALGVRGLESGAPTRTSGRSTHRKRGPKDRTAADLEATRAQARDLYRYNAYASGVVNTIEANLVSTGIVPQARVMRQKKRDADDAYNELAEAAWSEWAEAADPAGRTSFYEQQAQIVRESYVPGEALLVFSAPGDGREIDLATEVVPSERLALKDDRQDRTGRRIVQGVQFSAKGQIEGYWIYPNHPFDTGYSLVSPEPGFVPATRAIHYYEEREPGQVRGLTRFMTVANAFESILQWFDFLMIKERVASAFAVAITRSSGGWGSSPVSTGDASDLTDDAQNELDYLEGGIIAHLKPGEGISGISSNVQAAQVEQLAQLFLRLVARGLDVSYELVSRDLSNVTYLSARAGENQDRRHWEPQQERLNRRVNAPVWREVQHAAHRAGKLRVPALDRRLLAVDFIRPGWPWVDPSKDVRSTVEAIKNGLTSAIEEVRRRGGDARKNIRDLGLLRKWCEEEGVELDLFGLKPDEAVVKAVEAYGKAKGKGNGNGDEEAKTDGEEKEAA